MTTALVPGSLAPFTIEGLQRHLEKHLHAHEVRETARALYEAGAISYPFTNYSVIWDIYLKDAPATADVISTLSSHMARRRNEIDTEFRSPIWVDRARCGDHCGIFPLPTAKPSRFTPQQAVVFFAIAERYLELFDPRNAGASSEAVMEDRRFSWNRKPLRVAHVSGVSIEIAGVNAYVKDGNVYISIHDRITSYPWLIMPAGLLAKYAGWHKGTSVADLISLNPNLIEHLVSSLNDAVIPGGTDRWATAQGTFEVRDGDRYYHWPTVDIDLTQEPPQNCIMTSE